MSLASRSRLAAAVVGSGSGEVDRPFIIARPLDDDDEVDEDEALPDPPLPPPPPRSLLKMEGSEVDLDDELVLPEAELDGTATTEAAIAAVVAGTGLDVDLCSLLERSRSQKR